MGAKAPIDRLPLRRKHKQIGTLAIAGKIEQAYRLLCEMPEDYQAAIALLGWVDRQVATKEAS